MLNLISLDLFSRSSAGDSEHTGVWIRFNWQIVGIAAGVLDRVWWVGWWGGGLGAQVLGSGRDCEGQHSSSFLAGGHCSDFVWYLWMPVETRWINVTLCCRSFGHLNRNSKNVAGVQSQGQRMINGGGYYHGNLYLYTMWRLVRSWIISQCLINSCGAQSPDNVYVLLYSLMPSITQPSTINLRLS